MSNNIKTPDLGFSPEREQEHILFYAACGRLLFVFITALFIAGLILIKWDDLKPIFGNLFNNWMFPFH